MMSHRRKYVLNSDMDARLTPDELQHGYHFCNDWDGLLIGPEDKEFECCTCTLRRYKEPDASSRTGSSSSG